VDRITDEGIRRGWDRAADWWVGRYSPRGDVNREWIIDPVLLSFVGDVRGLRILDAGCGGGYLSRLLARGGARVVGVDVSARLLAKARAEEAREPLGVRYLRADLAVLSSFHDASFDAAVSNIVLQDVRRYREAIREIHRVLKPGGRFVFSLTHPAFEAPVPGMWVREPEDSNRIEDRRYLKVDRYFDRVAVFWAPRGLPLVPSFHRPLRDYFGALYDAGFLVSRLEEPTATKEALAAHYRIFADLLRIPIFLVIEAVRPPGRWPPQAAARSRGRRRRGRGSDGRSLGSGPARSP
jgi:SAM-dependent methyltransferase